jgi:hypothetical protein
MRNLTFLAALFCGLVASSLSSTRSAQKPIAPQPIGISMIQLIATPEKFDGKMISVVGFLAIETEDTRLYLSEEDYRHYIPDNGVFIVVNKEVNTNIEKVDLHYVSLVGVFKLKGLPPHYPGGTGEGGITDIRQCIPWLELTETRPRRLRN